MKTMQLAFLLAIVILTGCRGKSFADGDQSQVEGFPAKATANVRDDFTIDTPAETQDIADYIAITNKKLSRTTAQRLAADIVQVASCFGIDNRVLTSQIRQESLFSASAKSPTGAVGLLQMTGAGIQEVEDQLGSRGTKQAGSLAIAYFTKITSICLTTSFGPDFPQRLMLWKRAKTLALKKSIITSEPRVGLVFGAIQLKTLLSKAKSEDSSRTMIELYERALFLYNGDPKEQDHYQSVIMRRSNDIK